MNVHGVLTAALLAVPLLAADEAPGWLRELATAKVPAYGPKTPAVILLNEERVSLDDNGKMVTTVRYAVKVLTRDGKDHAVARRVYHTGSGKVRDLDAWTVYASGDARKFPKSEVVDVALVNDDMYNEARARVIIGSSKADPGSVFGYEAVVEDRTVFTQFDWGFQTRLPARTARFALTLPSGWRAESVTFNHTEVIAEKSGAAFVWQLRDLPPIDEEEASPQVTSLAPRLAVSVFPPAGAKSGGRSFASWTDVSRWLSELNDPQAVPNDALVTMARQLVAGVSGERQRFEAIARYAQSVRYVSIQTGLTRGGGYKPHAAGEVFDKAYGDCKDKSTLMRAMLKAAGIEAWPVAIYAGDRTYVRQDWPSPHQFNHAIVAVKVSDAVQAHAVVVHPKLGRLLFFDPTDQYTPPGWLPGHEQGSFALVVAGEDGALLRMPTVEPAGNRLERETVVALTGDGDVTVRLREHSYGESAIANRRLFRHPRPDYTKYVERWITYGARGAQVSKIEPQDVASAEFLLDIEFTAQRYSQVIQQRLLMFRPAILSRYNSFALTEATRKYPVVLDSESYAETVRIRLPAGFEVDEIPGPVKLAAPFGSFEASWTEKDGEITFVRKLAVQSAAIPPEQYAEARGFFGRVAAAERSQVVLVRK